MKNPITEQPKQALNVRYIQIRKFKIRVPNSSGKRLALGSVLTIVGIIPGPPGPAASIVGITILSIDYPKLRRIRRVSTVWLGRRTWAKKRNNNK
jgi:hypothetical protein